MTAIALKTSSLFGVFPVVPLALAVVNLGCASPSPLAAATVAPSGDDGGPSPPLDAGGVTLPPPLPDGGPAGGGQGDAGVGAGDASPPPDAPGAPDAALSGWTLVWSDEFNLPDGSPADGTKWSHETGGFGWDTNGEREYYTDGTDNAVVSGGSLVITATDQGASQYSCSYGTCQYTSARLNTAGNFEQKYGRFESRIKLPAGQGMWPAFWLLGNDIGTVSWPQCGEVDIMENIGSTPSTNYGSVHGPGYSGGQDLTGSISLMDGGTLADDFHVYALEWDASGLRFYFDGVNYETRTPADVPAGDQWVYDHPFFIILNVAVGGHWPGDPDNSTVFPQKMLVDYVRVYTKNP
jgi:beta-glucanase (GH16 family)